MILIEAGSLNERSFDAKVQFAQQLASRGHAVVLDDSVVPEDLHSSQKFDSVPFLACADNTDISRVLLIGAENISDSVLNRLHRHQFPPDIPVSAIGRFANEQERISTRSKLAYVLGFEPDLLDLSSIQSQSLLRSSIAPLFTSGAGPRAKQAKLRQLTLVLPKDVIEESSTLPVLSMLDQLAGWECKVVTAGAGKHQIRTSRFASIAAFGISELSVATLAGMTDIAVFYGTGSPGERMAAFALEVMHRAGVVIDCTDTAVFATTGAPVVRGPIDPGSLAPFLQASIFANFIALGEEAAASSWLHSHQIAYLEKALSLVPGSEPAGKMTREPRTVFFPTNGVGLGHAQRCSLIASEIENKKHVAFAAFPSCVPMLQSRGFDCLPLIQKSEHHKDISANDLMNYMRLGQILLPGDKLVFDGGYIFDSIYRTILEKRLSSVWIRRGLLQPGQSSQTPPERESVFDRVIVPGEAFEELNTTYSFGAHIHNVGPVVQLSHQTAAARKKLRRRLRNHFNHKFKKLVVTMLGGGEAADRTTQMQSLCAQFNSRPDCLHLMVVWPNAKISPSLSGWNNSHVVRTQRAADLCQASDFVVSAAGYNSFHEILYHRIPTIFIPQMANYMDDQERRARAASDRGLAVTVLSHELLMLQREVAAFLDRDKAEEVKNALSGIELPHTGTADAARLIEEVC